MVWRVGLLCVLIFGGMGFQKSEEGILDSRGVNEEKGQEDSQDFGNSFYRVKWSRSEKFTDRRRRKTDLRIDDKSGSSFGKSVYPCKLKTVNHSSSNCPFCVNDTILRSYLMEVQKQEGKTVKPLDLRCPYHYELEDEECRIDRTKRLTRYVKISQPGKPVFYDTLTTCPGLESESFYSCSERRNYHYTHGRLGEKTTIGVDSIVTCLNYCLVSLIPKANYSSTLIEWNWHLSCLGKIDEMRCKKLGRNEKAVIILGNNDFCYKKAYSRVDQYMGVVYGSGRDEKRIPITRRCGKHQDCSPGFCITKANVTGCDYLHKTDPLRLKCLFRTEDSSSLRISKDEWCCMDSNGCQMSFGRCDGIQDCDQDYCVRGENSSQTRCPVKGQGERGWDQCLSLEYGQTKWIEERRSWCCIPKMDAGCDSRVRSCGSDISCVSSYCIAEKRGPKFFMSCPLSDDDEKCRTLEEGQEHTLFPGKVCCRRRYCHLNGTTCGEDLNCNKDFCVAVKRGNTSETSCPTEAEEILMNTRCSGISIGKSIMVVKGKVWCCKMDQCATDHTSVVATTGMIHTSVVATTERSKSGRTRRIRRILEPVAFDGSRDRNPWPTTTEMILLAIIVANVVACFSCTVAVVCGRVVMFERKRARSLARGPEASTKKTFGFERKTDEFLEKLLHGNEAPKQQEPTEESLRNTSEKPESNYSLIQFSEEPTTFEEEIDKVEREALKEERRESGEVQVATEESEVTEFENLIGSPQPQVAEDGSKRIRS